MSQISRRNFLIGSLGLTLGGYTNGIGRANAMAFATLPRKPSASNLLGYKFSSEHSDLKNHYDAIVVGSGYGASVIAHRLSSKFSNMCILERGKEWHPGSFPETFPEMIQSLKTPLNPLGLIDIAQGQDIDIVCASGLGGTSLINAAIAIRPEMNVFAESQWPDEIKLAAQNGELERYYETAESMLQPSSQNQLRFQKTKLQAANALKSQHEFGELNLNIRQDSYPSFSKNDFGYPQSGCIQCGNCCSGCNVGAKNTLLTNYLFSALNSGVKVFTQIEVQHIEKTSDGYRLNLKVIPKFGLPSHKTVTANFVFLGAGAKGSTEILLRSQSDHFRFSNRLGTRLSANGDVMGISYNGNEQTNIIAKGKNKSGPIIASYINYRANAPSVDSQFLLLDGVVPSAISTVTARGLAGYALANQNSLYPETMNENLKRDALERIRADLTSFNIKDSGALNHSMLYFACGHDSSGGRFIYDKQSDQMQYVWPNVLKEPTFKRINNTMAQYSAENGGIFIPNPRSTVFGGKIQATHPLGGCPMGADTDSGVVNHLGHVFSREGDFHDNLYVVDAAIIPRSLSATPLLTITALAERIADKIS